MSKDKQEIERLDKSRRFFLAGGLLSLFGAFFSRMSWSKNWHLDGGTFRNNYTGAIDKSFSDLRKAFSEPMPPFISFPLAQNDPNFLRENRMQTTVTWVGHCTILLQVGGLNILTDPHFSSRASPVPFAGPKRTTEPGIKIDDLPPIDIILVSHSHYDHLDFDTQSRLAKHSPDAHVYVPLRLKHWFKNMGFAQVTELDWWEQSKHKQAQMTAVPTQHWSSRTLFDRNKTLWCGWAVHVNDFSFIFVGDSGYTKDYKDINEKLSDFDLAAIPIGAYNPSWFMREAHQNPEEAVECMQDLGAKRALATHWGTFRLTLEPMDEPPQRLAAALADAGHAPDKFMALQHGETRVL